jgi:hypothetical protein
MLIFSLMNVLFEAATIEGRARALGRRHQKQHLHDENVQSKTTDSIRRFWLNSKIRSWLISIKPKE